MATGADSTTIATSQTTTSTTPADLSSVGPSVSVTIGENGLALVSTFAAISNSATDYSRTHFAASGANTITPSAVDDYTVINNGTQQRNMGGTWLLKGLSPGVTTFTMKYSVAGNTGTFKSRTISVVPL